jgi:hypothetical protein
MNIAKILLSVFKPEYMIHEAQKSLLNNGKLLPFGLYNDLIDDVSTAHWDAQGGILKDRRTKRKAWIFFGIYSPELICGIAIADAGIVANAFTYFYSFKDGNFIQDNALVPLGMAGSFDPGLHSDWKLGKYRIYTKDGHLNFEYNGKYSLRIKASNNTNGASIIAPSVGNRPFNFTYKNVCMPSEVVIEAAGKKYEVKGNYGAVDFTKGYPPRETIWNWLSFIGTTKSGKSIGLNLVKHFNNELENVLWVDGKKTALSSSNFEMKAPVDNNPWHITSTDGILDCTITPSGARRENVNVILMKSIFVQTYGKVTGTVLIDGVKEDFTAYGVSEDHHALW